MCYHVDMSYRTKVKVAAAHDFRLNGFYWANPAHQIGVHTADRQAGGGHYLSGPGLTADQQAATFTRFDSALAEANRIGSGS